MSRRAQVLRNLPKLGKSVRVLVPAAGFLAACAVTVAGAAPGRTQQTARVAAVRHCDVGYAHSQITRYERAPAFQQPGPAFNVAAARGKTIFNIPASGASPFNVQMDDAMKGIAQQHGVHFIEFPNQGEVSQWAQGINTAIGRKVNLIALTGAPNPLAIQPQLKAARAAGIKVLLSHVVPVGGPTKLVPPRRTIPNVDALVTTPYAAQGQLEADFAIQASRCNVDAVVLTVNDVLQSRAYYRAIQSEFAQHCTACRVRIINIPITQYSTMQTVVQSALVKDPSVNYVIPLYDLMVPLVLPGIIAAGAQDRVKVVSADGTPAVLKDIQAHNIVAMDVGDDAVWAGWANMDQALRILAGQPTVPNDSTPLRVFDSSNIAVTGVPPQLGKGYGNAYSTGYTRLWKTGK